LVRDVIGPSHSSFRVYQKSDYRSQKTDLAGDSLHPVGNRDEKFFARAAEFGHLFHHSVGLRFLLQLVKHVGASFAGLRQLQQILNTALIPGDSGGFPLSGTATDTGVNLTISTITFTGTHSGTTMDLKGNLGSDLGLPYTMTLKLVRQ